MDSVLLAAQEHKALPGTRFGGERGWSNLVVSPGGTPFEGVPFQRVDAWRGLASAFAPVIDGLGTLIGHQLNRVLLIMNAVFVHPGELVTEEN